MKKNLRKIASLVLVLIMMVSVFVGCGSNDAVEIKIIGEVFTEFKQGENIDLSGIKVEVTFKNGETIEVDGNDKNLEITGLSTATVNHDARMTIKYDTVSIELPYKVYGVENFISSQADIAKIGATTESTYIIDRDGVYKLTENYSALSVNRDIEIKARNGVNVKIESPVITVPAGNIVTVAFRNVTIVNKDLSSVFPSSESCLKMTSNGSTLIIDNCTIEANGRVYNGLNVSGNTHLYVDGTTFTTRNTTANAFLYCVYHKANRTEMDIVARYTNNTFNCNFAYGVSDVGYEFIGNNVEVQYNSTTSPIDSNGATLYSIDKNPVMFHFEIIPNIQNMMNADSTTVLKTTIKDNTVKNLENYMRIYYYDMLVYPENLQFDTSNNTLTNVKVLLGTSTGSYTGTIPVSTALRAGVKNDTGYSATNVSFMQKATKIVFPEGANIVPEIRNGVSLYYDLRNPSTATGAEYVTKNLQKNVEELREQLNAPTSTLTPEEVEDVIDAFIDANTFEFVGIISGTFESYDLRLPINGAEDRFILKNGNNYYIVLIKYSADAKDSVCFYDGETYKIQDPQNANVRAFSYEEIVSILGLNAVD